MIVGGGYQETSLKQLAKGLEVGSHLVFAGAISHDIVPQYVAAADVCVACFEDNDVTRCKSPLKIVEYLACGKAVVASRVGEVENMIADVGVLVEPGSVESLARGICQLIDDKVVREQLGFRARQRAQAVYNWGITARNLLVAYGKAGKNTAGKK